MRNLPRVSALASAVLLAGALLAGCGTSVGGPAIPSPVSSSKASLTATAATSGTVTATPITPELHASTCSLRYLPLPDPGCTPGATNPDVTQATISSTICKSGWTKTIRPPVSYTNKLKVQQIAEYGYADTNVADYEEDHFLPLEDGGSPTDPRNLWPQPHARLAGKTASDKDTVENRVKAAICSGQATLVAAQHALVANWTTALAVLGIR